MPTFRIHTAMHYKKLTETILDEYPVNMAAIYSTEPGVQASTGEFELSNEEYSEVAGLFGLEPDSVVSVDKEEYSVGREGEDLVYAKKDGKGLIVKKVVTFYVIVHYASEPDFDQAKKAAEKLAERVAEKTE